MQDEEEQKLSPVRLPCRQRCIFIYKGFILLLSLVIAVCMLTNLKPGLNLWVYYSIPFPLNINFITMNVMNIGLVLSFRQKGKCKIMMNNPLDCLEVIALNHFSRVMYQLNTYNLICFVLQFIYFITFEIFKIRFAPRFYYGNDGTSIEAIANNHSYNNGQ